MSFKPVWLISVLAACGDGNSPLTLDASPPPPAIDAPAPPPIDAPLGGCAQNTDCAADQICHWAPQHACGLDRGRGACAPSEAQLCPDLAFWVCGCDGSDYINECLSDAQLVDVAYGGPCRPEGVFAPCTTSADCPTDLTFHQFCVDDPRDDCDPSRGDTGCAGTCVHANQTCIDVCSSTGATSSIDSPDTEACIALAGADPDADPGACVYTTRVRCASAMDCSGGEVCMTELTCDPGSPCLGWCVRP